MAETKAPRPGEAIAAERLGAFLSKALDLGSNQITVEQFPSGSSNLTYLVIASGSEYVLRRPPFGNTVKTAHDMRREFDVLSKLSAAYAPAPTPLLFCGDTSVIGSEFYLMERRHGLIIRGRISIPRVSGPHVSTGPAGTQPDNAKTNALATAKRDLDTSPNFRLKVCESFIRNFAVLHSLDTRDAGLETFGKPDGYNRRQVEGWTKRYFAARTSEVTDLEKVIVWLNDQIPPESGASLIHNDYKFDNVMLDPLDLTRITAVLDWEMVTIGDPLMDLGTTLGYWMSKDAGDEMLSMPFNPRVLMENVSRQELVEMYATSCGRPLPDMLFYYVFGTFKIAVIAQQIYARYVKGFTTDARFATFDKFVVALGLISNSAIESKQI